jgi:hypothetical protein
LVVLLWRRWQYQCHCLLLWWWCYEKAMVASCHHLFSFFLFL